MLVWYTEDEPQRRVTTAAGTPKERAVQFAREMQKLGFLRMGWLLDTLGVTEYFAVWVSLPSVPPGQQLPAELCGFRYRGQDSEFDPCAGPESSDPEPADPPEPRA